MDPSTVNLLSRKHGSVVLLRTTDLGSATCERFQLECDRLQEALRLGTMRHVVVDCSDTVSWGCTALGLLVRLNKATKRHGGYFALCGLSLEGLDVLRLVKLDQVWPIYRSTAEALDAIGKKSAKDGSSARPLRNGQAESLSCCS